MGYCLLASIFLLEAKTYFVPHIIGSPIGDIVLTSELIPKASLFLIIKNFSKCFHY